MALDIVKLKAGAVMRPSCFLTLVDPDVAGRREAKGPVMVVVQVICWDDGDGDGGGLGYYW